MGLKLRRGSEDARLTATIAEGEIVWSRTSKKLFVGDGETPGGFPVVRSSAGYGLAYDTESQTLEVSGLTTDDIAEGQGIDRQYFTVNKAQDAAALILTSGIHAGITFQYDELNSRLNATVELDGVGITDIVADTSPELGGNLNLNQRDVTGVGNIDIVGNIEAAGNIVSMGGSLTIAEVVEDELSPISAMTITPASISALTDISVEANLVLRGQDTDGSLVITNSDPLNATASFETFNNSEIGSFIAISRSRGTVDTRARLEDGDNVGNIAFLSLNSTGAGDPAVYLATFIEGVTANGRAPGRLEITVADPAGDFITALEVRSNGLVKVNRGITVSANNNVADGAAISLSTVTSYFATSGTETATLGAGTDGQMKVLVAESTADGAMTVTVINPAWGGAGTIVFPQGSTPTACTLQYVNAKWHCIGNNGATFA
jgi:hypothetical protein